jgi:hypothetical protein
MLDEGTDCWRPVQALRESDGVYVISSNNPDNEGWAFPPNARVRCREHLFSDGQVGLVAYELAQ